MLEPCTWKWFTVFVKDKVCISCMTQGKWCGLDLMKKKKIFAGQRSECAPCFARQKKGTKQPDAHHKSDS